ncbi:hypothetical protein Poli38472_010266 [Pythium oligandrum]|uniref:Mediator of RNA polymerase II transcription subunit 7 n=1 Tax=Pythium oligandrum TaxID=41045 RepID=A0A8K1CA38_PYTOL|nr:hypothetical protein Poli38472_010266 [Pythium oligandrum]|eukprot:TMW58707.1 hypothetical protein Poli38472_010266 [Pythium oligandrum]
MEVESNAPPATNAAPEDAPEIVSAFPAPPAFFVLYADGVESGPPPPETMEPTYHMFGTPYSTKDVVPDLLPQPGKKLYLDGKDSVPGESSEVIDYKAQMKKINHSLLANFTELVDVLIKKPSLFNEKLADLELLFLNMHNLINAFRPHQARETIIHMLKTQINERREAAQEIRRTIDEARRAVEEKHEQLHQTSDDVHSALDVDIKMEDAQDTTPTVSPSTDAQAARQPHTELSTKAREVQQMQESFFAALQSASSS